MRRLNDGNDNIKVIVNNIIDGRKYKFEDDLIVIGYPDPCQIDSTIISEIKAPIKEVFNELANACFIYKQNGSGHIMKINEIHPNKGSSLDDFLREEGISGSVALMLSNIEEVAQAILDEYPFETYEGLEDLIFVENPKFLDSEPGETLQKLYADTNKVILKMVEKYQKLMWKDHFNG